MTSSWSLYIQRLTVTFASMSIALRDVGVTEPKHVRAVLMLMLTHCRRAGLLIKYPLVTGRFKRFECSTP